MKICHILWGLTYGGIETMVINIANEQAALGHEVHLVIVNDKTDAPMLGLIKPEVSFHNAGRKVGSKNPIPIFRLNLIVRSIAPDVIHFHHVRLHHYIFRPFLKHWCTTQHIDCTPGTQRYIHSNPHLYAISHLVRRDVLEKTGCDSEVVLNGIDPRQFKKKTEFFKGGRTFTIVQVGRLDEAHKGQHILIEAAKILRDRGADISVDIIGTGPSEEHLEKLIRQWNLTGTVRLCGSRQPEYIRSHLADYDLLVQPSLFEGFGLTIAEGMAARVPVLVSDVEAQLEVIDNGRYGYHFKSADPRSLADAIADIISCYDTSKVDAAERRVNDLYNVRVTAANYIAKYQSL